MEKADYPDVNEKCYCYEIDGQGVKTGYFRNILFNKYSKGNGIVILQEPIRLSIRELIKVP